jgi:hypothetical protein
MENEVQRAANTAKKIPFNVLEPEILNCSDEIRISTSMEVPIPAHWLIPGDSSKKSIPIIITNRTFDLLTGNTTDAGARVNALNFERAPIAKSVPFAIA